MIKITINCNVMQLAMKHQKFLRCFLTSGKSFFQTISNQWQNQPDNLITLCKFQAINIIHFFRNIAEMFA